MKHIYIYEIWNNSKIICEYNYEVNSCINFKDVFFYFVEIYFLTDFLFQIPEYRWKTGGSDRTRKGQHGMCLQRLSQYQRYSSKRTRPPGRSADRYASTRLRLSDHMPADQVLSVGRSESLWMGRQIALHRTRLLQRWRTSRHGGQGNLQKARHRVLTNDESRHSYDIFVIQAMRKPDAAPQSMSTEVSTRSE